MFSLLLGAAIASALPHMDEIGSYIEEMRSEVPVEVCGTNATLANLNLNGQGNIIAAHPGERIYSLVNFSCSLEPSDNYTLYQMVIGYEEVGPKKCILNELGYRCCGAMIQDFWLEAPLEPGVYNIQGFLDSSSSKTEAMRQWDSTDKEKMTIGRIIVLEP